MKLEKKKGPGSVKPENPITFCVMGNKGSDPSLLDSRGAVTRHRSLIDFFDKRLGTNLAALILTLSSFGLLNLETIFTTAGLFALSEQSAGLRFMLFERVPGLYGSGIIPLHFEDFKRGIHDLIMKQFFSKACFHEVKRKSEELRICLP